jgi:uncharacterized protein YukE
MTRIRVNTEDLKANAKVFELAADEFGKAGDDILSVAMSLPSYDGQLSGPARKAAYEIQAQMRNIKTCLLSDAQSLQSTARAFEEADNQFISLCDTYRDELALHNGERLAATPTLHGNHNLGYEIDYEKNTITLWYNGHYVVYSLDNLGPYSTAIDEFKSYVDDYQDQLNIIDDANKAGVLALLLALVAVELAAGLFIAAAVALQCAILRMDELETQAKEPWGQISGNNNPYIIASG